MPIFESGGQSRIGRYSIVAELARGGMGIVYLAASHGPASFSKVVALKELKPEFARDPTYVTMFLEEARIAARLRHPNVVQTNDTGVEGDRHYTVMEFLDGRNLYDIVRRLSENGGLPVGAHLTILAEALRGLHYVHELRDFDDQPLGLVHRDFSPLNVLVTLDGQVKVIDFGIVKAVDSPIQTSTGMLKGRVAYMAPEQAWGAEVDRRADLFSAGVMIWEAAAGRRLWPNMPDIEILARVVRDGPPRLRSVRPSVPRDLVDICERAMAADCDRRYGTAAQLLDDLERHLASRSDRMTMREIGAVVAGAFAEERRRTAAVIDEALRRASSTVALPRFAMGESPSAVFRAPTPSMSVSRTIPPEGTTPSAPAGRAWVRYAVLAGTIAGVLSLAAVGLAFAIRRGASTDAPTGVASWQGREPGTDPVTAAPRDRVGVAIRVSPPGAQIMVDDTVVAGNPFFARYPKDAKVHHVVTYADGFDPKWRDVSFATDVTLDLVLERRAPDAGIAATAGVPVGQLPRVRTAPPAPRSAAPELSRTFPADPAPAR